MGVSLLSNPPYNLTWTAPPLCGMIGQYAGYETPPASNANYAFILAAVDKIDDVGALILPNSVLTPKGADAVSQRRREPNPRRISRRAYS